MRQTIRPAPEKNVGTITRIVPPLLLNVCTYTQRKTPECIVILCQPFLIGAESCRAQRHRSAHRHSTLSCPFPVLLHRCVAPQQKRVPRVRLSTRSTRSDVAGPASDLGDDDDDDDEDLDDDDDDDDVHLGLGSDLSLDDL